MPDEKYRYERFLHIAQIVLGFEGGYSDDPNDAGGKTNLGVTEGTLARAYKKGIVKHNDIRSLSKYEALQIYFHMYWIPAHCYELNYPLDFLHFDLAINAGTGRAVRNLQQTVNAVAEKRISVDGMYGPETRDALFNLCNQSVLGLVPIPDILCYVYLLERVEFYDDITDGKGRNAKQEIKNRKFLRGWIRRVIKQKNRIPESHV